MNEHERVDIFFSEGDGGYVAHYRGREEWDQMSGFGITRSAALQELASIIEMIEGDIEEQP